MLFRETWFCASTHSVTVLLLFKKTLCKRVSFFSVCSKQCLFLGPPFPSHAGRKDASITVLASFASSLLCCSLFAENRVCASRSMRTPFCAGVGTDWSVVPKRTEKRPAQASSSSVPIDAHIRVAKERLAQEKQEVPSLLRRASEIRKKAETYAARRHLRMRRDMEDHAAHLQARADHLQTDGHVRDYERNLAPFLEAYARDDRKEDVRAPTRPLHGSVIGTKQSQERPSVRSRIVAEYLAEVCNETPKTDVDKDDTCVQCGGNMVLEPTKAIITCAKCGYSCGYLDATCSSMSFGDEITMGSIFSYKRLNHFQEQLLSCQGKESMQVPPDVLEAVMEELYSQRVTIPEQVTHKMVRNILKKLKMRKMYEHVPQIHGKITGIPPHRMTPEVEELCRLMFIAVQAPFNETKSDERKNFMSYNYCLFKFLELIGEEDFLPSLQLLRGVEKLRAQDEMFAKICKVLRWPYKPSI